MTKKYSEGDASGLENKKLDGGWVGKFLGMGDYALKNVMGIITIILVLNIVGVCIFIKDANASIEIITIISPILTLMIGYLAGSVKK